MVGEINGAFVFIFCFYLSAFSLPIILCVLAMPRPPCKALPYRSTMINADTNFISRTKMTSFSRALLPSRS